MRLLLLLLLATGSTHTEEVGGGSERIVGVVTKGSQCDVVIVGGRLIQEEGRWCRLVLGGHRPCALADLLQAVEVTPAVSWQAAQGERLVSVSGTGTPCIGHLLLHHRVRLQSEAGQSLQLRHRLGALQLFGVGLSILVRHQVVVVLIVAHQIVFGTAHTGKRHTDRTIAHRSQEDRLEMVAVGPQADGTTAHMRRGQEVACWRDGDRCGRCRRLEPIEERTTQQVVDADARIHR
mmetsp:Transcript_44471/g.112049  ORF Transcript_44471/g.112049 Transcript_44471/m.112049 type:complete len:235 (+) Transcript_44471:481-1185(+)